MTLAEYVKYVSDEHGNIISYDDLLKIEKSHKGIDQSSSTYRKSKRNRATSITA